MENAEGENIVLIVAIGCSVMLLLACFIIFFVVLYQKKVIIQKKEVEQIKSIHQQELLRSTLEVEEKERERIAKNIHDDLGALISILRLNNSRTTKNINNKEIIATISAENNIILNRTSESVRSISKKLASPTLTKLGYEKALRELTNSFNQTGEITMTFSNNLENPLNLPSQSASHLFRVSQEIINNIVKHDHANEVHVSIYDTDNNTFIAFNHSEKGIDNAQVEELIKQHKGLGLSSIQSRLSIIGATIDYKAQDNETATVKIKYPNDEKKN